MYQVKLCKLNSHVIEQTNITFLVQYHIQTFSPCKTVNTTCCVDDQCYVNVDEFIAELKETNTELLER